MPGKSRRFTSDVYGRDIYFTEKWYKYHIKENHPSVTEDVIRDTLKDPNKIYGSRSKVYIKNTNKGKFKVVVRRFNKTLYIITAYKLGKEKPQGLLYN
jgi:hypothetical protein